MRIDAGTKQHEKYVPRRDLYPGHELDFALHGDADYGAELCGVVDRGPGVRVCGYEREFDEQVDGVTGVEEDYDE
jgi:hypothetical protein